MARPLKDGVDYFPFDTNTDNDQKFQIVEARYGIVGYGIILKIYQMIYGGKGYYCEWNDLISAISASKWSCVEFPVTEKQVGRVVRVAAKYGIFDKDMLNKYGILTSNGIQKRYFGIAKRRQLKNVESKYLLISVPENPINVDNNGVFVCRNPEKIDNKYTKKSKENKTIFKESIEKAVFSAPTLSEIKTFVSSEKLKINPEKFYYYYQNKKWQGISDWKAKAKEWNSTEKVSNSINDFAGYDLSLFEESLNKKVRNV